jgi:hypothetical protein
MSSLPSRERTVSSVAVIVLLVAIGIWEGRTAARVPGGAGAFPALNSSLEPLCGAFNRDAGRVRLVMIIDPT